MERVHVIYRGNVHGVGFRFTAERIGTRLGLTGFVKNLSDGTVEVVCEGDRGKIDSFLEDVKGSMEGYIRDTKISWEKPRNEFGSFGVNF